MFKKVSIYELLFLLYFIFLGLIFWFLVPPFQKPDEFVHFKKALRISKGNLNTQKKVFNIERKYSLLLDEPKIRSIPFHYKNKFPISLYSRSIFASRDELLLVKHNLTVPYFLPVLPYIPYAIGLYVFKWFHFNYFVDFFAIRGIMFIFSLILVLYILFRIKQPFLKYPLLVMLGLPMTIHQLTAYSYDPFQIILFSIYFILIFGTYYQENPRKSNFLLIFLVGLLLLLSRKLIEPLVIGLPLILIKPKLKNNKIVIFSVLVIAITSVFINLSLLRKTDESLLKTTNFRSMKEILIQREVFVRYPDLFIGTFLIHGTNVIYFIMKV